MAKLDVDQPEALGRLVAEYALESGGKTRNQFIANATALVKPTLKTLPPGHEIKVQPDDEADTTWLILPSKKNLDDTIMEIEKNKFTIPAYYDQIDTLGKSADQMDRVAAYYMRLSDCLMSRCR